MPNELVNENSSSGMDLTIDMLMPDLFSAEAQEDMKNEDLGAILEFDTTILDR